MRAITANRRAVREALAHEGWRFALIGSQEELKRHRNSCRTLTLPVGNESENRSRSIRETIIGQLPWEICGQPYPRWLSYISKSARRELQPNLPLAAEFCLIHGFVFLVGNVWAEREGQRWRIHRGDAPAVLFKDSELYFWRGWHVSKGAVTERPSVGRILKETNQTEREVLLERMGVENFVREAELKPADTFRGSVLLKVDTAEKQARWVNNQSVEEPVPLAFLKVICPSTQKTYFLRVDPDAVNAKQALQSTLPGYERCWAGDLVAET